VSAVRSAGTKDRARREGPRGFRRATTVGEDNSSVVALHGATVLLVEDDPLSREALELVFAYYGAHVISADSASAAPNNTNRLARRFWSTIRAARRGRLRVAARHPRARARLDHHMPAIAISGSLGVDADTRLRRRVRCHFSQSPCTSALLLAMQQLMERAGN
jgi:CheY-like chemotaxis protein